MTEARSEPPASSQDAWAWRRSCIRALNPTPEALTAGCQMRVRKVFREGGGLGDPVLHQPGSDLVQPLLAEEGVEVLVEVGLLGRVGGRYRSGIAAIRRSNSCGVRVRFLVRITLGSHLV